MTVKVAAIVRTNVPGGSLPREFLNQFSDILAKEFSTQVQHVTAEVQTDCLMVRAGSSAPMAVVQLYHNQDRCNDTTKHQYAQKLAQFIAEDSLKIPTDRVLVLFHDTRVCSNSAPSIMQPLSCPKMAM
ncbi:uncharacterized protein LOC143284312 [Babylonia areolata]|uniref:uncharacterized protein LOC143284312 n=1 Tax=Babylonia areolata TaxID=304850 RepID=UPI003FD5D317